MNDPTMSKKKSILIVDEDPQLVTKLTRRCRQLGLRVRKAHTAFDAMAALDEELPDLVCVDVTIETGNELSICQMMETDRQAARIPVIVITKTKDRATITRCGDMCAYYLRKDEQLVQRIDPFISELVDLEQNAQVVDG